MNVNVYKYNDNLCIQGNNEHRARGHEYPIFGCRGIRYIRYIEPGGHEYPIFGWNYRNLIYFTYMINLINRYFETMDLHSLSTI